jgi:hypothetical protein
MHKVSVKKAYMLTNKRDAGIQVGRRTSLLFHGLIRPLSALDYTSR